MALNETEKRERSEYLEENLQITDCSQETPYVFISYASDNWETVFKTVVVPFQKQYGLCVYADKAFDEVNDKWMIPMRRNISGADVIIVFVSQSYIESYACFLELLTAVNNNKQIVFVSLGEKLHRGKTGDVPNVEPSAKRDIINQGENVATNTNNTSSDLMRAMKTAYANIYLFLEQDKLSKYDISDAFINFFRDASINEKSINDLGKVRKTIEDVSKEVFDKSLIEAGYIQHSGTAPHPPAPAQTESSKEDAANEKTKTRAATSTGDITYTIYGKEYTDNQANMMLNVFNKVLKQHPDAVDKILADPEKPLIRCASAVNYELPENKTASMPSRYNSGRYFNIEGRGIFIGTGLNYPEKLRNISQLLTLCKEDFSILQSEQIELPDNVKTKASSGGAESYSIYGKEYSGNQTQMMVDALKFLIEKHFDKREELAGLLSIKLSPMSELSSISYFRVGEEFSYRGVTYSIGTSFGRTDKLKQIAKAIKICGEDISQFQIDGLEDAKPTAQSSSKNRNFDD